MFTTKGFFSQVPCPHQADCHLPTCIFSHPKEDAKSTSATESIQGEDHVNTNNYESRKRRKLENENLSSDIVPLKELVVEVKPRSSIKSHEPPPPPSQQTSIPLRRPTGGIFATDREISPPPLQRKPPSQKPKPVQGTVAQNVNNNNTSSRTQRSTTHIAFANIAATTPVKARAKQESLNPRALKTYAPASHDMRYRLLRALHEQFSRLNSELAKDSTVEEQGLVLSEQDLIKKALDIEEGATLTPTIYSNVVKNKILVYKRMSIPQWKEEIAKLARARAAEADGLSDSPLSKLEDLPKPIETGLSPEEDVKLLLKLHTPIAGLLKHGYVSIPSSKHDIERARQGVEAAQGWEVCDRCRSRFQVFPGRREDDGSLTSGGPCTYHFRKALFPDRSSLDPKAKREKKYLCCGQALGDSTGCTKCDSHVFKITEAKRMAVVLDFQETPNNPAKQSAPPVCIDGEMGYTVYGLELIRLTATSWLDNKELFDVLVRPLGQVLDLNTRYSGVEPMDMAEAIPWDALSPEEPLSKDAGGTKRKLRIVESPAAARALLFSHISPQTPIIGHGLENDLNATRIIHPTIVDTALLYPHEGGLPRRYGLKTLMSKHLNRDIQVIVDGKMEGHDSKEDANAAGDLVRLAVANKWRQMQKDGWTLQGGEFVPPPTATPTTPTAPLATPRKPQRESLAANTEQGTPSGKKRLICEVEDGELAS